MINMTEFSEEAEALVSNISWNNIDMERNYQVCDADSTLEIPTENPLIEDQNQTDSTESLNVQTGSNVFHDWRKDSHVHRLSTQVTNSPLLSFDDNCPSYPVMFSRPQPFNPGFQCDDAYSPGENPLDDRAISSHVITNATPEQRIQPHTTTERRTYEEYPHHTAMINSAGATTPFNIQRNVFERCPNRMTATGEDCTRNIQGEDYGPICGNASFDIENNISVYKTLDRNHKSRNEKFYTFPRFFKTHRNIDTSWDYQPNFASPDTQDHSTKPEACLNNPKISLSDNSLSMQMVNEPNVAVFKDISQRSLNSYAPVSLRTRPPDCNRHRKPIIKMEPEYLMNEDEGNIDDYNRESLNMNFDTLHTAEELVKTAPFYCNTSNPSTTPPPSLSSTLAAAAAASTSFPTLSPSLSDSREKTQRYQVKPFRQPYLPFQLELLETSYNNERFCSGETRNKLVKRTGLSDKQIRIWYQNRRAKSKKRINALRLSLSTDNPTAIPDRMSSQKDDDDNDGGSLKRVQLYRPWFPFGIDPKVLCPVHRHEKSSRRPSQS